MTSLLRKVQHSRWYDAVSCRNEPVPADPLSDLGTKHNRLSVWQVLSSDSNLEDIIAAIAATRAYLTNIDVVLIDEQSISQLGIKVEPTQGQTPLAHATDYHRDLVQLQAQTLVNIADVIRNRAVFRDFSEKQVGQLLARYIHEGRLNAFDLADKLRLHLERKNWISPAPGT